MLLAVEAFSNLLADDDTGIQPATVSGARQANSWGCTHARYAKSSTTCALL
jgi:hypothetical protein